MAENDDLEAKLSIPFDVKGLKDIESAGQNLERLRAAMQGATEELRANSAALRSLRGNSDEVKAARARLKGAIDAERDAVSGANLKLIKMGTTYEALTGKMKKAEEEKRRIDREMRDKAMREHTAQLEALKGAVEHAGGPLADLQGNLASLRGLFSAGNAGAVAMVAGVALLAAAMAALTVAIGHGAVELAIWTAENANALRAMALTREAMSGSAANAAALGSQVDALARKLPLSTAALSEMASEITRTFSGTQLSGQGIVDTFQAVAGASSAMGAEVGRQLQGILERGKQWGRVGIGRFELQGTGLQFDDLAKHVAKAMHTTVEQARLQLYYGMVPINAAAAALRDAVNERFGEVNAKKMLDLTVIATKFGDRLRNLTKGVDLTPVLESLEKLSSLFDTSTVTGDALKQMITIFGQALGATFKAGTPVVQQFFENLIIWAQRGVIWALEFALAWKNAGGTMRDFGRDIVEMALNALGPLGTLLSDVMSLKEAISGWKGRKVEIPKHPTLGAGDLVGPANDNGAAIVDGMTAGIRGKTGQATAAVRELGENVKDSFRNNLQIGSPSRVFADYGQDTAEGYARGVDRGADDAGDAIDRMSPQPAAAGAGSGVGPGAGAGGTIINVDVQITVTAAPGQDGKQVAAQIAQNIRAELLAELEGLMSSEAIPSQTVQAA